jgi:hypothetical protein
MHALRFPLSFAQDAEHAIFVRRVTLRCAGAAVALAACGWEMVSVQQVSSSLSSAVMPSARAEGGRERGTMDRVVGAKAVAEKDGSQLLDEQQAVLVCIIDQRSCGVSPNLYTSRVRVRNALRRQRASRRSHRRAHRKHGKV